MSVYPGGFGNAGADDERKSNRPGLASLGKGAGNIYRSAMDFASNFYTTQRDRLKERVTGAYRQTIKVIRETPEYPVAAGGLLLGPVAKVASWSIGDPEIANLVDFLGNSMTTAGGACLVNGYVNRKKLMKERQERLKREMELREIEALRRKEACEREKLLERIGDLIGRNNLLVGRMAGKVDPTPNLPRYRGRDEALYEPGENVELPGEGGIGAEREVELDRAA